jgi:hypothetical protein
MIDIELAAVPNQQISIVLDAQSYTIAVRDIGTGLAISITRDGLPVVTGARICPGSFILPYKYQEAGNFALLVNDEALPDWQQLGVSQSLVYLTAAEMTELRA